MKTILTLAALLLSLTAYADEDVCKKLADEGATSAELARSGCCSWHGGVCGCSGGRAQCPRLSGGEAVRLEPHIRPPNSLTSRLFNDE